jgi:hypothetical protein
VESKLTLRARNFHSSAPSDPYKLLYFGIENKIPASDLLQLLGYFVEPYQLFIINIIWYGEYANAYQVNEELKLAQDIHNIWGFLELQSDLLWERKLGVTNLRHKGLQFLDEFLWWEKDNSSMIA